MAVPLHSAYLMIVYPRGLRQDRERTPAAVVMKTPLACVPSITAETPNRVQSRPAWLLALQRPGRQDSDVPGADPANSFDMHRCYLSHKYIFRHASLCLCTAVDHRLLTF